MKLAKGQSSVKWRIALFTLLGLVVLGGGVYAYTKIAPQRISSPTSQAPTTPKEVSPVSISANTLFLGDVFWGRYVNDWSMASPLKTAYPFSRLGEFKRESYDAWIANLNAQLLLVLAKLPHKKT